MAGPSIADIDAAEAAGRIRPEVAAMMRQRYGAQQTQQLDALDNAARALPPLTPVPQQALMPGLPSSSTLTAMDPGMRSAVAPAVIQAGAPPTPAPTAPASQIVTARPASEAARVAPGSPWPPVPGSGLGGIASEIARGRRGFETRTTDRIGDIQQAGVQRSQAVDEQGRAAVDRAAEMSKIWGGVADENQRAADEQARYREDYGKKLGEQKQELGSLREDARYFGLSRDDRVKYQDALNDTKASVQEKALAKSKLDKAEQIDPKAAFGGGAGKILAVIGLALGGYASAFTGRNDAMTIVNKAIDDNIEAQKTKMAQRRDAVVQAQGEISATRQEYFDGQQGLAAQKLAKLDVLNSYIEQTKAKYAGTDAAANLSAMQADIKQQQAQLEQQFDSDAQGRALQSATSEAQIRAQNQQTAMSQMQAVVSAQGRDRSPIPGTQLVDPSLPVDDMAMKDARKRIGDYNQVQGLLGDLAEWRKKHGAETVDREAAAVAKQLANRLVSKLKTFDEMGASFTDMERELINNQIPEDPTKIGYVLTRLESMSGRLRSEIDQYLEPRNIKLDDAQSSDTKYGARPLE